MTKQELLTDLASKMFVDTVGAIDIILNRPLYAEEAGREILKNASVNEYDVHILEINKEDNAVIDRKIRIYVLDEGSKNERAYYKENYKSTI